MSDLLNVDVARECFANAILKSEVVVPSTADISIRSAIDEATTFRCDWPLVEKGPCSGNRSREITVQISSVAMHRFCSAEAGEREEMLIRFIGVFNGRLLAESYDEQHPPSPPLIIHIDEYALAP